MCIRDRSGRPYKSTIDKIAKAIDDPELIQELYDATGYSSKKIRERKKIIADNGFSLDLSTVQVHEKFFSTLMLSLIHIYFISYSLCILR